MTAAFFTDLTITLLGYFILAFSYLGLGWAASRVLNIVFNPKERLFSLIWLGWAVTLFMLQFLNIFIPIAVSLSIAFLLIGTILAFIFLRLEFRFNDVLAFPSLRLIPIAVVAIWIASLSMFAPTNGDSGLYHFNSIRWLNEYPIVLGLVNLHNRLAFNESFFAYAAYLNLYPFFHHGYSLANSFLLLVLLAESIFNLEIHTNKENAADFTPIKVVAIFFIPFLIYYALFTQYSLYYPKYSDISSPTPDTATAILQILIFIYFVREFNENPLDTSNNARIAFILIMSATMITVKLSNLLYVCTLCAILVLMRLWPLYQSSKQTVLTIAKLMVLPALIIMLWSLRGILLSGCPAYPSTFGCMSTRWAAPIESVRNVAKLIYSWARQPKATPDQVLYSWVWLSPWFKRIWQNKVTTATVVYPLIVSILGVFVEFIIYARSSSRKINKRIFLIPLPTFIALLFWFYTAPAVRFAQALFWLLPISIMIVVSWPFSTPRKIGNTLTIVIFIIVNASIGWVFFQQYRIFTRFPVNGYRPIPIAPLAEKSTISDLKVWSPTKSDQCWNSAIPCTPYFDPALEFFDNKIFPEFILSKTGP
jgi:hypothetical protein